MHNGTPYGPEDDNRDIGRELQLPGADESPFDALRQADEYGEFWSGRDLMPHLDYGQWRRFEDAVERAIAACRNSGDDPEDHFAASGKITKNARGHHRTLADYRLSRHGAYLVAINADPRKESVAKAQTYFAVQTRKQEIAEQAPMLPAPRRELSNRDLARMVLEEADRADREAELRSAAESKLAELQPVIAEVYQQRAELSTTRPKAEYVDNFVNPTKDVTLFRTYCAQIQAPEQKLRRHLIAKGIIYKKVAGRRYSKTRQRWEDVEEYHARAAYKPWFHRVDQTDAPRLHNGQLRTTLYITPVGKVAIAKWLARNPIEVNA